MVFKFHWQCQWHWHSLAIPNQTNLAIKLATFSQACVILLWRSQRQWPFKLAMRVMGLPALAPRSANPLPPLEVPEADYRLPQPPLGLELRPDLESVEPRGYESGKSPSRGPHGLKRSRSRSYPQLKKLLRLPIQLLGQRLYDGGEGRHLRQSQSARDARYSA